ncbi:MAG: hypothetical protein KGI54_11290 [Pseudomonadota bacterium]|nr:hypothetical protein [Pseudomonadota bacterium]
MFKELATYQRIVRRIESNWDPFLRKRNERLTQQERHGVAAEKVAENIIEDLLTMVLDWSLSDLNNQVGFSDILLTNLGIKHLIIEVKRPGSLAWNRHAVETALNQAVRYADEQKVRSVAVSDGIMLYAADIQSGGLQDRIYVPLDSPIPQESLWWISQHAIYRPVESDADARLRLPAETVISNSPVPTEPDEGLLHPKYKIPASCFAYVGNASKTSTWKLPYLLADGSVDTNRLPKAIQCIISNYRGARVSAVDEKAIPDVLVRLAKAAVRTGRMPYQVGDAADVYVELARALEQLGRYDEIRTD